MAKPVPVQILAVDLVRFGCAMLVLAFHFGTAFPMAANSAAHAIDPQVALPSDFAAWSWFGWVGVEIFFVVSGFLIAMSADGMTTLGFLRRRMLRLAPAAWVCASLTAIVVLGSASVEPVTVLGRWLAAMLFYPVPRPLDDSYWTLGVELCFYILVAAFLAREGGPGESARISRLDMVGLALGGASIGYWVVIALVGWTAAEAVGNMALNLSLLPHGLFFALGIILAELRARGTSPLRIAAVTVLFLAGCGQAAFKATSMNAIPGLVVYPLVPVLVFAIAVAVIAFGARLQRPLACWIGAGRLATIGLMTYPLYLMHQTIGAALIVAQVRSGIPAWLAMILGACVLITLAFAIARYIEPPLRRWLGARVPAPGSTVSASHGLAPGKPLSASPPIG